MKVVKASVVNPNDDGLICYLSRKEAEFIRGVCGYLYGSGPNRAISTELWHKPGSVNVPCHPVLVGNIYVKETE